MQEAAAGQPGGSARQDKDHSVIPYPALTVKYCFQLFVTKLFHKLRRDDFKGEKGNVRKVS